MNHASLFSGIGGFDLAAQWMGWKNVMQCEINPFCQKILRYHFPRATIYGDIRDLWGGKWKGKIDILSGGFPCQPFSAAGRRRGTGDNRFLWPEMLRVIREIQPTWIVAENVRGLLTQDDGVVLERVRSEMEASGYECQPILVPACAVNAPHRRERVWFIAHRHDGQQNGSERKIQPRGNATDGSTLSSAHPNGRNCNVAMERKSDAKNIDTSRENSKFSSYSECRRRGKGQKNGARERAWCGCERYNCNVTDSECSGLEGKCGKEQKICTGTRRDFWGEQWIQAATRLCRVDDGLSRELDGITIPKWRRESIKAYGNAIVPQVAFQIFQAIEHAQN